MRFVHVSDTHIAADPAFSNYGHRPLDGLAALVDAVNALSFPVDFVLHTGDVVEDGTEAAYRLAAAELSRLRLPVRYLAGNHDRGDFLQRVLLGRSRPVARLDDSFRAGGIDFLLLDSRGPHDPEGTLHEEQLAALKGRCAPEGPPLVIAIHHPPVPLDTPWLDQGWERASGRTRTMLLDRGREFREAVQPARARLRGVFFGHVHRAFQVVENGVLYASAPSAFAQLLAWPSQDHPEAAESEPAGFSVVTVTDTGTTIRQHALPRRTNGS